ncbi:hypothetical protein U1Q18_007194, partial [Sarracenia purpurea var. burkii]
NIKKDEIEGAEATNKIALRDYVVAPLDFHNKTGYCMRLLPAYLHAYASEKLFGALKILIGRG